MIAIFGHPSAISQLPVVLSHVGIETYREPLAEFDAFVTTNHEKILEIPDSFSTVWVSIQSPLPAMTWAMARATEKTLKEVANEWLRFDEDGIRLIGSLVKRRRRARFYLVEETAAWVQELCVMGGLTWNEKLRARVNNSAMQYLPALHAQPTWDDLRRADRKLHGRVREAARRYGYVVD